MDYDAATTPSTSSPAPAPSRSPGEGRRHGHRRRRGCTWRAPAPASLAAALMMLSLLLAVVPHRAGAFVIGPGPGAPATTARRRAATRVFVEPPPPPPPPSSRREVVQRISTGVAGALLGAGVLAGQQGAQALEPQSYVDQLREAMPVKTIRGTWRIREYRDGSTLCKGRIKMKGFVEEPNKGTLDYTGCNDGKGKGNWLLKPARIDNGQIRFSARWKVRFTDGDSLIYRGDVLAGGNYAKATATITKGEILKPVTGITGNLTERRIGTFEADLIEPSDDEEKL